MDFTEYVKTGNKEIVFELFQREVWEFIGRYNPNIIQPEETNDIPIPVILRAISYPCPTVSVARVFGLQSNAGLSPYFSRGDHIHGTPDIYVDGVTIIGTGNIDSPLGARFEGYQKYFFLSDWTGPALGFYSIIFQHNLNDVLVECDVRDAGGNPIDIERHSLDANAVVIRVPYDPDLRFPGFIWIKTT